MNMNDFVSIEIHSGSAYPSVNVKPFISPRHSGHLTLKGRKKNRRINSGLSSQANNYLGDLINLQNEKYFTK
jgi:hypothetical protein